MAKTDDARIAWILWQLFLDLENLLWEQYEDEFLDFIMDEEDTKHMKLLQNTEYVP